VHQVREKCKKKRLTSCYLCNHQHRAKFKSGTLPAIGVFDVIEHVEDDIKFLNHLCDLLVPSGDALLNSTSLSITLVT
jgi:2-polyprenyl-3-methyl-5-hydroxy-6-metoxy-1,4-benzoquinol methylase